MDDRELDAEWIKDDLLAQPTEETLNLLDPDLRAEVERALDRAAWRIASTKNRDNRNENRVS